MSGFEIEHEEEGYIRFAKGLLTVRDYDSLAELTVTPSEAVNLASALLQWATQNRGA